MAWLTRLSLRNRALVGLASVLVAIFGVISMTSLKQELIPSLQIPIAAVVGPFPGASPAVVEQQVTAPMEAAVKAVPGSPESSPPAAAGSITRIDGTRSASITATPNADDLGAATADLQQRLDALELPPGATAEIGGVSAEQDEAFASSAWR